jgi:hypothetical protein
MLVSRSHMTAVDLTLLDGFSTLATTDEWSGVRIEIMARQVSRWANNNGHGQKYALDHYELA